MPGKFYERGLEMRKQMLGAAHVEQTLASVDKFTEPLEKVVHEFVWGAVWARPGLETRTRCMREVFAAADAQPQKS